MTTPTTPVTPRGGSDEHRAVVAQLVSAGLLAPERQGEALEVLAAGHGGGAESGLTRAPLRRRLVELTGYIGGALVIGAVGLVLAQEWSSLADAARITLLGVTALVLAAAAAVVMATGGGGTALRRAAAEVPRAGAAFDDWRRRLGSVLVTGAALAAAATVAVSLEAAGAVGDQARVQELASIATFAVVAVVGYLLAPSLLGQVAVAGGVAALIPAALQMTGEVPAVLLGSCWMGVGAVWLALAHARRWREAGAARVVGVLFLLVGAQTPLDSDHDWVAYLLTTLTAAAGLAAYLRWPDWPYLAMGVAGLTLAVPEALADWTEGSLGAAGVLLVAGVTLLVASLVAASLRRGARPAATSRP